MKGKRMKRGKKNKAKPVSQYEVEFLRVQNKLLRRENAARIELYKARKQREKEMMRLHSCIDKSKSAVSKKVRKCKSSSECERNDVNQVLTHKIRFF